MKNYAKKMLITFGMFALASTAMASQKIIINLGGQKFKGQNTLKLKQLIKSQRPQMNLQRFDIESVKLVAKSKFGQGTAKLVVGQVQSYPTQLAGTPFSFNTNRAWTYDRVFLFNPKNNSQGKWQIHLKGNIKVKKVVVFIDHKFSQTSATCTSFLMTRHGRYLNQFTGRAVGNTQHIAQSKACNKAMMKCEDAKSSSRNPRRLVCELD